MRRSLVLLFLSAAPIFAAPILVDSLHFSAGEGSRPSDFSSSFTLTGPNLNLGYSRSLGQYPEIPPLGTPVTLNVYQPYWTSWIPGSPYQVVLTMNFEMSPFHLDETQEFPGRLSYRRREALVTVTGTLATYNSQGAWLGGGEFTAWGYAYEFACWGCVGSYQHSIQYRAGVPEPATTFLVLGGAGAMALLGIWRRRGR